MNLESANLILRSVSTTNKNATNQNITWDNINLKQVLGTLYDKYDNFKICLTSFGNVNAAAIAAVNDRVCTLNMRGLNWINQTYDSVTNTNRDGVVLSTTLMPSANGTSLNYTGEIGWVFQKPSSITVSINITITRASDGLVNAATNYGDTVYCFSIYGVEE